MDGTLTYNIAGELHEAGPGSLFYIPEGTVEWFEPGTGRRLPGGTLVTEGQVVLAPPFEWDSVLLLSARD